MTSVYNTLVQPRPAVLLLPTRDGEAAIPSPDHPLPVSSPAVIVTPVITVTAANAYAAGQCLGGLVTLPSVLRAAGETATLQWVSAQSAGGLAGELDVFLLSAPPTAASTIADKAPLAIAAADQSKVLGLVRLNDIGLLGAAAPTILQPLSVPPIRVFAASGTTIYALFVPRVALTPASVGGLSASFAFWRD